MPSAQHLQLLRLPQRVTDQRQPRMIDSASTQNESHSPADTSMEVEPGNNISLYQLSRLSFSCFARTKWYTNK